jgi:uncharacterized membrane protein YphA (DoxX/SURF4 family)
MLGFLMRAALTSRWVERLVLLALCAAYIQGGLDKLADLPAAVAEQASMGVPMPAFAAWAVIVTELVGSILVVSGWLRWFGALWLAGFTWVASLLANAFWTLPPGPARFGAANGFFEHLGLVGGFLLVALLDLRRQYDARAVSEPAPPSADAWPQPRATPG